MVHKNIFESLRNPRYTGANRCYPCTVVNLSIAIIACGVVTGILANRVSLPVGLVIGTYVLLVCVLIIWFRGYLFPGTPTLTRRYAPRWFLSLFGKEPIPTAMIETESGEEIDLETTLLEADVVREDPNEDDLVVTDVFLSKWEEQTPESDALEQQFASIFGVHDSDVEIRSLRDGEQLRIHQQRVLVWPSSTAKRADLRSGLALRSLLSYWQELSIGHQAALIAGIRIFLPHCPDGGATTLTEETVESCCRSYEVIAVVCEESGERLYEHTMR